MCTLNLGDTDRPVAAAFERSLLRHVAAPARTPLVDVDPVALLELLRPAPANA